MHEKYLGDSFDILKRFWVELLSPVAPMMAHSRFIPDHMRQSFTRLTGAPIFDATRKPRRPYSLLLDPHAGIPLPDASYQKLRMSHVPIEFIADLFADVDLLFVACYD